MHTPEHAPCPSLLHQLGEDKPEALELTTKSFLKHKIIIQFFQGSDLGAMDASFNHQTVQF